LALWQLARRGLDAAISPRLRDGHEACFDTLRRDRTEDNLGYVVHIKISTRGHTMGHIAKIFQTGRSQAVRLPAAFRFDTSEVYVRRDEATGDVILSRRPADWSQLLAAIASARTESQDFLADRVDAPPQERELF
jgi:antitoxin VapB